MELFSLALGKLTLLFATDEVGRLCAVPSVDGYPVPEEFRYFPAFELQVTGENPDTHHGGKRVMLSGGTPFLYESHQTTGNETCVRLKNDRLSVNLHYRVFGSALQSFAEITNISGEAVPIEYVSSFALSGLELADKNPQDMLLMIPRNSWSAELDWKTRTLGEEGYADGNLQRITASSTGTWSTKEYLAEGCLVHPTKKFAFFWQIEHNGSWSWEIGNYAKKTYLRLSGPSELENGWWKNLSPGETFTTVTAAIACGSDFDEALAAMTLYRRRIAHRPESDKGLPIIFNDYLHCLDANPTTERELPVIDAAAKAGAEIFCMDAGWYANGTWWETVGEWEVEPSRFPGGIKKVFDRIHELGMIPGIWLEPEVIGIHCPILDRFSDEDMFMRHGKRVIDHGRYQFDFRSEKVRSFLKERIDYLIRELGIGYLKFDYNIEAGIGTELAADSAGDGLLQNNRAYLSWLDELHAAYPDLIIENCASGGMRMEYASLAHTALQSLTDAGDYARIGVIAAASGTSVLPEQAAVWAVPNREETVDEVKIHLINAMFKRIHLSGHTPWLSDDRFSAVTEGLSYYRSIRDKIPAMLPFYPLGVPRYTDTLLCAGYRYEDERYLTLVNLSDKEETVVIPICAKTVDIPYGTATADITAEGTINVHIPARSGAVVFCR